MILSSEINARITSLSVCFFTIFTATVVSSSLTMIPVAVAFMTTPKAPVPSCFPSLSRSRGNSYSEL
uniref:Putative secreted peptide n=1 Tax=Anopheles braziliensis TaxID=58242 RepID=A0A2M3ZRM3_9DIPT